MFVSLCVGNCKYFPRFVSDMDRRSSSDVPPTPPKRASLRKDSESTIGENTPSSTRLLRDSGFSESATLSSSYDDFVLVPPVLKAVGNSCYTGMPPPPPIPLLSPRGNEPSSEIPPPLPPKVLASAVDDEDGKSNRK